MLSRLPGWKGMGLLVESNTKQVTIETPRLNIRPLQYEDVPALAQLGTDEVFELVPEIETPFDARGWVKRKLENEEPIICHVVCLRKTGMPIGIVQAQIGAGQASYEFSIGYWLGREYWGNGYATEALRAMLENLTEEETKTKELWPLFAHVHERNAPSVRVLEKCGFVLEGSAPQTEGQEGTHRYRWKRD